MVDMQRTLTIVKPDAVSNGSAGKVLSHFEQNGLRINGLKMVRLTKDQARAFYFVHKERDFYESLCDFMSSGPCIVAVLSGDDAINRVRHVMGATNPAQAELGTIRADFGLEIGRNLVHGSDGPETAVREISLFFEDSELLSYERDFDRWIFE